MIKDASNVQQGGLAILGRGEQLRGSQEQTGQMEKPGKLRVLLVEDNADFARLAGLALLKSSESTFEMSWKRNVGEALNELGASSLPDIIVVDYFLPGKNGLQGIRELKDQGNGVPVVLLTVCRDFDLAVELMKMGADDYLLKDDLIFAELPQLLLRAVERVTTRNERSVREVGNCRLEAIRLMVSEFANETRTPMGKIQNAAEELTAVLRVGQLNSYASIIKENIMRIHKKLGKLESIEGEKTVAYVGDIKMLDLS